MRFDEILMNRLDEKLYSLLRKCGVEPDEHQDAIGEVVDEIMVEVHDYMSVCQHDDKLRKALGAPVRKER